MGMKLVNLIAFFTAIFSRPLPWQRREDFLSNYTTCPFSLPSLITNACSSHRDGVVAMATLISGGDDDSKDDENKISCVKLKL